jgi:hypothetical protein
LLDGGVMARPPGVAFEYANIGYAVLGRVVEKVSGVPMREYVRRTILEPLRMTHGGWQPDDFPAGTVAVGYRGREGSRDIEAPRVIAPAERLGVMDAAGGLYTTVNDLARYAAFHVAAWPPRDDPESGPLKRSSVREMQQGDRSSSVGEFLPLLVQRAPPPVARAAPEGVQLRALAYGFGLQTRRQCEPEIVVEHSGGLPGYTTWLTMLPEVGVGIVVFLNDERVRSKATASVMKLLRTAGLFVPAAAPPLASLALAPARVNELMSHWDDAQARALFEPSFFRYQTIETLKDRFAALTRDHGGCRFEGHPSFVNRLRGTWRLTCDRGALLFAAGLAPGPRPRLQGLEWREELPPSRDLETAGASMLKLLEKWDTEAATQRLARAADVPALERAFAALAVAHGPCKMDRSVDSDGKTRAAFLLSCQERPLELTVELDASGKVAQATGRPPPSAGRPNCAD